jgi:hypothetical protein
MMYVYVYRTEIPVAAFSFEVDENGMVDKLPDGFELFDGATFNDMIVFASIYNDRIVPIPEMKKSKAIRRRYSRIRVDHTKRAD